MLCWAPNRGPLVDKESKEDLLAVIAASTDSRDLLHRAVRGVFTPLLADHGASFDDLGPDVGLDPSDYTIPTAQWQAIVAAVTNRAGEWGTGAVLALHLVNLLPSSYDDPVVPAPPLPTTDHRPGVHEVRLTREATDVIAACDAHVDALGRAYGWDSPIHLRALRTWHRHLAQLFSMATGADTRISADGPRSLFVATSSGFVYGVVFHGATRRCTTHGCAATLGDDGTAHQAGQPGTGHAHEPSYPLDAPQPGEWTAHS